MEEKVIQNRAENATWRKFCVLSEKRCNETVNSSLMFGVL